MQDSYRKALDDISEIRSRIAAETPFRGLGPLALAVTGLLALGTAIGQVLWLEAPTDRPFMFFAFWLATAVASLAIIAVEAVRRSRHAHSGIADAVIIHAIERFLPVGAAGAFLLLILMSFAPETLFVVPGLWQVLVGLAIFASARTLPSAVSLVGAFYFVVGFGVLMLGSIERELSPLAMGLPFAIGQLLMALAIHFAPEQDNG